jgi:GNAT superfamily N-acetyltransferase
VEVVSASLRAGDTSTMLGAFAEIGESLYATSAHPAAARPSGSRTRSLLDGSNPTARRCRVKLFVDDRAPARVAAIVNPRLVEDGAPIGLLGFFEAANDPAAVTPLLTAAVTWLREQGCATVRGPVNFSTWHDYRFATGGGPGWFPGEPYHHDYYPELWTGAGFAVVSRYATYWVNDTQAVIDRFAPGVELARRSGVELRTVEARDLPALYRLAVTGFAANYMYSPIEPDEFAHLYAADRVNAGASTSYVALADGAPVGFYYTFPTSLPAGEGQVGKTIVVDPAQRKRGIYHLLMTAWLTTARDSGRAALPSLVHLDGSPALMGWHRSGDLFRNYVLFEHQRG